MVSFCFFLGAFFIPIIFFVPFAKKIADTHEPLRNYTAAHLLKHYELNKFHYDWLGLKLNVETAIAGQANSFKTNLRIRHDSILWASISPLLGIEMVRAIITEDSVKYISRIPENKYYYAGSFAHLAEMIKMDIDLGTLQDILVGRAVGLDKENGKFRSEIDGEHYLLVSKYKRRIRRVVGVDNRKLDPKDTVLFVNPENPRYQKTIRNSDEEELIISRYWLDPENFYLVKCILNDLYNRRTIQFEYSDYDKIENQFYPKKCRLSIIDTSGEQEIKFQVTRIATDKKYDFPFEIPSGFDRKINP